MRCIEGPGLSPAPLYTFNENGYRGNQMGDLKVQVSCKDCGRERIIEPLSPIIPIIGSFSCLSDGPESAAKKCSCGCEAFFVLKIL
jgi:hypothetical protein